MPSFLERRANKITVCLGAFGVTLGFLFIPGITQAADIEYDLSLDLTGGAAAAIDELESELGPEGYGWEKWYGQFTDDGYLLENPSALVLMLGDNFSTEYVHIEFEARGIDNDVSTLSSGGKDGYMFNMWSTKPGWCDPCNEDGTVNTECDNSNWGFGIKKWPIGMGHPYSNSILMQGIGMFNGTAVPGAGIGDRFTWDSNEFYKIEVTLHGGQAEPSSLAVNQSNGSPILNSPGGVPYGPASLSDRDGVEAWIGGEFLSGRPHVTYEGVTIRNVRIQAGTEPIPAERQTYPPQCEEETGEDVDDPTNPYDTCACHAIPDVTAEPPCEDELAREEPRKVSFLDPFPFKFERMQIKWLWNTTDVFKEGESKNEQMAVMPDLAIDFAPPSPEPGTEGAAIASTRNYRTRMQNLYFAWCMVKDELVYPMNSIVAGGQELPQLTEPDLSWADGGCCQPIARIPADDDDFDGDGMSDTWEELMFINRGDFGYTSIEQVQPGDDPDQDGYFANKFANQDGEYLTVTPYLVGKNNQTFVTGGEDAQLTNIEEYILDTDPLNGDSDSDGYADEMDFIGVGQMQFKFQVDKLAGPEGYYDLSVATVGVNDVKKISLVSGKRRLFVGGAGVLKLNLLADKEVMTFDDSQQLKLGVSKVSGTGETEDMEYEWYFNGESVCNGQDPDWPELCDVGQREVILGAEGISFFDLPPPTSNNYTFTVEATSPEGRGYDRADLTLPVATPVTLVTEGCLGQTNDTSILSAGDQDPVMVCISEIEEMAAATDLSSLNFIWSKDGQTDEEQSGSGKSSYALVPTKPAGEEHIITVQVKDTMTSDEIINSERPFAIAGPSVNIIDPENQNADIETAESYKYSRVDPGEQLNCRAEIEHFTGNDSREVAWSVGGATGETYTTEEKEIFFTFEVPPEAADGDSYSIGVQVQSQGDQGTEQASDNIILTVGPPGGQTGAATNFFGNLAAAFTKIPEVFREVLKYVAIMALVFFGLIYVYPKVARYLGK